MAYGGVELQLHSFVIPALEEEEEWIAPNTRFLISGDGVSVLNE
jgi:hypothetical protein